MLQFHVWRRAIFNTPADKRYCVASVWDGRMGSYQCSRKPKHEYGGHGWCNQHYPPNEHARKEARSAEYQRQADERKAGYARDAAERSLRDDALQAIRQIAAGHNDPRALALEVLREKAPK